MNKDNKIKLKIIEKIQNFKAKFPQENLESFNMKITPIETIFLISPYLSND